MRELTMGLTAALAVAAVGFAGIASAHTVKFDSAISAKYEKPTKTKPAAFAGEVSSPKARCMKNRDVNVRMRLTDGTTPVVAKGSTDAAGEWRIEFADLAKGTYFAQVKKKALRKNSDHKHVCKRAFSKDVKVQKVK